MKSLRQLTDELIGVRLNATNVSLWQTSVVIREAARCAINDAIATFPARVQVVQQTAQITDGVIVLPRLVDRVIRIDAVETSYLTRHMVSHWDIYPTPTTTYVRIHDAVGSGHLEVTYVYPQPALPADLVVSEDTAAYIKVNPYLSPSNLWPSGPCYVELYQNTRGGVREVFSYSQTSSLGFLDPVRGIEGVQQEWTDVTEISCCYVAPDSSLRPVMLQAQAVMYEFWLRHRALYEQYTALASMQALSLEDLQLLIRDLEGRALSARRRNRHLSPPSSARLRRPIPK